MAGGTWALRLRKGGHAGELVGAIWFEDGFMAPVRTLGRAVLSILVVALGAAVGREGALKQVGAGVGWQAAHHLGLTAEQRRALTACGAGAGMAAAYNIPLAGAVFAMEVLLGSISLSVAAPALACSVTATSWLLLPMRMTYATPPYVLTPNLVVWAAVAGPIIGLFAVAYVRLISWADLHKPKSTKDHAAILRMTALFAFFLGGGVLGRLAFMGLNAGSLLSFAAPPLGVAVFVVRSKPSPGDQATISAD